jgi:hypothetical protein
MIDLKRLERATHSAAYKTAADAAGAAVAGALLAPTKAEQEEAMERAIELHNKMADVLLEEAAK